MHDLLSARFVSDMTIFEQRFKVMECACLSCIWCRDICKQIGTEAASGAD